MDPLPIEHVVSKQSKPIVPSGNKLHEFSKHDSVRNIICPIPPVKAQTQYMAVMNDMALGLVSQHHMSKLSKKFVAPSAVLMELQETAMRNGLSNNVS